MIINMTGGGAAKPKLTSIAVTTQPTKTAYEVGESFNTSGMIVTAYFDDGSSSDVTGYTCSPTTLAITTKAITISYTHEGITKTATVSVSAVRHLYSGGNKYEAFTGGWTALNRSGSSASVDGTVLSYATTDSSGRGGGCFTTNQIDFANASFTTLKVNINCTKTGTVPGGLALTTSHYQAGSDWTSSSSVVSYTQLSQTGSHVLSLPVSTITSGSYYVALAGAYSTFTASEVWFE